MFLIIVINQNRELSKTACAQNTDVTNPKYYRHEMFSHGFQYQLQLLILILIAYYARQFTIIDPKQIIFNLEFSASHIVVGIHLFKVHLTWVKFKYTAWARSMAWINDPKGLNSCHLPRYNYIIEKEKRNLNMD